jgi:glycosidase
MFLRDIGVVDYEANQLTFLNSRLRVHFNAQNGVLNYVFLDNQHTLLTYVENSLASIVDFKIDGQEMIAKHGAAYLRHSVRVNEKAQSVTLQMTYGVGKPNNNAYPYELTCNYTLYPEEARLERSARVYRPALPHEPSTFPNFEGFIFRVPNAQTQQPDQWRVGIPGAWTSSNYLPPATPLTALQNTEYTFPSAPDNGFGLLIFTNSATSDYCSYWMDTHSGEVNYTPSLNVKNGATTLQFKDHRAYILTQGTEVLSDTLRMECGTGDSSDALLRYRQWVSQSMPLDAETPQWVKQATILEVNPDYFRGGFREITQKLPFYRKIGFNTLSLMPHWEGGYAPLNPFSGNPKYGTQQDLKNLVKQAHTLGMKVLFDMVIHGFSEKSSVLNERPDIFARATDGSVIKHSVWGSLTVDWSSPNYWQYMGVLVSHDLREYDIDGYRVNAASYKEAQWDINRDLPAYQSGTYSPQLMKHLLRILRHKKPDSVLLSEACGSVFHTASNFVQDNQPEAVSYFLERFEKSEANAEDYKQHLTEVLEMLPKGANRVFSSRSHNTSWIPKFGGYTPRFMAMEAIHALCGIPKVYAGDLKSAPNPDTAGVFEQYRQLFALRQAFPEIVEGELLLREVDSGNPMVFSALKRTPKRTLLILVSLTKTTTEVEVSTLFGKYRFSHLLTDPTQSTAIQGLLTSANSNSLKIRMKPYQVLVSPLMEGADEIKPVLPQSPKKMQPQKRKLPK